MDPAEYSFFVFNWTLNFVDPCLQVTFYYFELGLVIWMQRIVNHLFMRKIEKNNLMNFDFSVSNVSINSTTLGQELRTGLFIQPSRSSCWFGQVWPISVCHPHVSFFMLHYFVICFSVSNKRTTVVPVARRKRARKDLLEEPRRLGFYSCLISYEWVNFLIRKVKRVL